MCVSSHREMDTAVRWLSTPKRHTIDTAQGLRHVRLSRSLSLGVPSRGRRPRLRIGDCGRVMTCDDDRRERSIAAGARKQALEEVTRQRIMLVGEKFARAHHVARGR